MQVPRYRNSNYGWKSRFFFVRPSKDQFPFCTKWRHPQVRLFNSPFEVTPLVECQVKILECLDRPASMLSDVLTEENMLSVGLFKPTGMKFNLVGVIGSVPLATDEEGPSSPEQAKRRKTATKAKRVAGDKNALVSTGGATEDDHIDLTRGADPMHADDDHTAGDSPIPDLHFLPAQARRDMEVMRSCVISHMSEGISRRKIEDIEKVLTLEDSLVKACKRTVTNLEVVVNEKSKEIHHLKKKNSSLKKSCEASEARVKEQEEEIDNLRAESMSVSISLTKEWISIEHPGINLNSFDRFLARRGDLGQATEQGQAAEQDGTDDHVDDRRSSSGGGRCFSAGLI
ncbi:Uncharacterized protein Adt_20563 [Abeliophyllum distichum]|uniref:Transposase (Putative), gypsy type n=1 Tax=Abeliophyllum distichum TaxID=126358 RepID=A0ABD1SWX3_9LAMI